MIRTVSIFLLLLIAFTIRGQSPEYLELVKAESKLQDLFTQLYTDTLSDPDTLLNQIQRMMPGALELKGAMDFPWTKLNRIGVVNSEDGKLRVFTWQVADDPNHYRYFGYIQVALKKRRIRVYPLVDNHRAQRNLKRLEQSVEDWYGKLYYRIVTRKFKRKTCYTLLGMDFNNSRSIIKTIEAVVIQRNKPQFQKELFFDGIDNVDRLVFEYSSQVSMTVNYDPNLDMITFDHLVPFHPIYKGTYEFYGPDGSFDGIEFVSGRWVYREDLDARNLD
jgi:hypothetical protein